MNVWRRVAPWFRSARTWIALGILAPLGMVVTSGLMLADLRRDAWASADQTSWNLLQVLERDIARNIEMYDLSIRAAVDKAKLKSDRCTIMKERIVAAKALLAKIKKKTSTKVTEKAGRVEDFVETRLERAEEA